MKTNLFSPLVILMIMTFGTSFYFSTALANHNADCPIEKVVNSKKSSSELIIELKSLMKNKECSDLSKSCQLRGEGEVSGAWKKHRIFLDNAPIVGANDLDGIMENVNELRSSGVCVE